MPNIIEKYTEINKGFVLLISGPINKYLAKLGKHLAKKFKFTYINANTYIGKKKLKFDEYDKLMDWSSLNNDVSNVNSTGVVVTGFLFPKERIKFRFNFHIHLSLSKQFYINYRKTLLPLKDPLKEDEYAKMFSKRYYYYLNTNSLMFINKFLKIDELSNRQIYEKAFDLIIAFIENKLYNKKK